MFHVEQFLEKFLPELDRLAVMKSFAFIEQEYMKWNKVINISSIRDKEGFWTKHVLDSLCLVSHIKKFYKDHEVMDIGSGGGFPGLILGICLINKVTMVEPIKKKTDFIDHCALRLNLKNTKVINSKYEEIKNISDKTIIVSRALGEYDFLYEYFKNINKKTEFVFMMTTQQGHKFNTQNFTEEYDFINVLTKNSFKNNVLARIVE
ncbi:MAG: 16S rRNA (guanine(527)-N(7))-methyltransferase RsmG [Proteobacteria bacterium]|nr:16S rRNA (guanine(527)-N(7))-methyltransferase RsmG [Pseudomonadota bacterium]